MGLNTCNPSTKKYFKRHRFQRSSEANEEIENSDEEEDDDLTIDEDDDDEDEEAEEDHQFNFIEETNVDNEDNSEDDNKSSENEDWDTTSELDTNKDWDDVGDVLDEQHRQKQVSEDERRNLHPLLNEEDYQFYEDLKSTMRTPDFDILETVHSDIRKIVTYQMPINSKDNLHPESNMTISEFSNAVDDLFGKNTVTQEFRKEMCNILHTAFSSFCSLPIYCTKKKVIHDQFGYYKLPKASLMKFNVCPNGCTVFVASAYDCLECPICGEERFHPCTLSPCVEGCVTCVHSFACRVPKAQINYIPFIPRIIRALRLNGKSIAQILKYKNADRHPDFYTDVMDGNVASQAILEMEAAFILYKEAHLEIIDLIEINLILFAGWDGGQVYKNKVSNFWPLFLIIQNLPPTFRYQDGGGNYLSAIFTKTLDSAVEDFLFADCLFPELNSLREGVLVQVPEGNFFLQARWASSALYCYNIFI